MRFDEPYVFFDYAGEVVDGGVLNPSTNKISWRNRMNRYQKIAELAKGDWSRNYTMVLPMVNESETEECKAALIACMGADNLQPPAVWYRELRSLHPGKVLATAERKLVIGSKARLMSMVDELHNANPGVLLCGLHELPASVVGYRYVGDVPLPRMRCCIGSLFTEVINLGGGYSESVLKEAEAFGITVKRFEGERYVCVA